MRRSVRCRRAIETLFAAIDAEEARAQRRRRRRISPAPSLVTASILKMTRPANSAREQPGLSE